MADSTGQLNDKNLAKMDDSGGAMIVKTNLMSGSPTTPTGHVSDKSSRSLINSGGEVLLNILPQ